MSRNPVEHAALPKEEKAERNIWTAEMLFKALDVCDDDDEAGDGSAVESISKKVIKT